MADGNSTFPGRCCVEPNVEFVGNLGYGQAGDCVRPVFLFCTRCGVEGFGRCRSTRMSRCRSCAGRHRRQVQRMVEQGIRAAPPGLLLTITAPGDGIHCRRHRRCSAEGPTCVTCECTPLGGVDIGESNRTWTARRNRVLEGIRRGEASPKIRGRRATVPVAYFDGREVQDGKRRVGGRGRMALHSHVALVRTDGKPLQLDHRMLRELLIRHGFGHSFKCDPLNPSHSHYVSKYVSKSADVRADVPFGRSMARSVPCGRCKGSDGRCVDCDGTGRREVGGTPLRATYRAWTASRNWASSMAQVREEYRKRWLAQADPAAAPEATPPLDLFGGSYALSQDSAKSDEQDARCLRSNVDPERLVADEHGPPVPLL